MNMLLRALSSAWHCVDVALGPVMVVLVGLPGRAHPLLGLVPVSVLAGAAMVVVFKAVSNQERIRSLRERMKGHLLGALVFNHSFRAVMRSVGSMCGLNLVYLWSAFVPMLIMIVPLLAVCVQLEQWYSRRPLSVGEPCLVSAYYRQSAPADIRLRVPPGSGEWAVSAGFDFPSDKSVVWQVSAQGDSPGPLLVETGGHQLTKQAVASADALVPLSRMRTDGTHLFAGLAHAQEAPLPAEAGIRRITLAYPARRFSVLGWHCHWAVWFFGLTIAAGLVWGRVFKVAL